MPITFLTSLERKRYEQMPEDIREGDLRQFFHLTIDDLTFIMSFYSNVNRIAVGIRIGLLRYLGFVPNTWKESLSMLFFDFIIKELGIEFSYAQLLEYGKREQTETEHLNQILKYLQFRKWQPLIDEPIFEQWLVQQGMELDEHTTDTHGYSDLNFALFDLVGKHFYPRIKDLKNQRLYKVVGNEIPTISYPALKFTGTVNVDYLKKHKDEMTRIAASLITRTVTPPTLIAKLQAYPKQNNLMYVLQSYGKLVKTIFICKYLLSQPLRKKINAQLNKGEQLHGLRVYLWFGGDGFICKRQEHEQQITARSLNLLTNFVIIWNTVYIQEVLRKLQKEEIRVDENDFEHISPAPFEHINRLGKYSFEITFEMDINGLRPLRK